MRSPREASAASGWDYGCESALTLAEWHLDRAMDLDSSVRASLRPPTAGKLKTTRKGQKTLDGMQVITALEARRQKTICAIAG